MSNLKRIFSLQSLLFIATLGSSIALVLAYFSPYIHPSSNSIIALFGLGYPVTISVHLVLILIWAFIKKRNAIIFGILVALGGPLHLRTFAIGSGDDPNGKTPIKIMSYNVHLFDRYNDDFATSIENRNKIFSYLREQQPDIACFQEYYQQDRPTKFVTRDSIKEILSSVDTHEGYAHRASNRQYFGIAIFSKYPIIEKGELSFNSELNHNYCIYADIIIPDDTVRVYNVHFQSIRLKQEDYALFSGDEQSSSLRGVLGKVVRAFPPRAEQAEKVIEHVRNSPHPAIVCGDFNDTPLSYAYGLFNQELTDAFRNSSFGIGKTFAGKIPAGRIDYIFHSPLIGSNNFEIQKEKLSDHYAISCEIFPTTE